LPKALYSTAPEALHSTAPEAVPQKQAGLEAYQLPHYDNNKRNDNYKSSPEKRILGLQPVTFWLLLVLTLVIVAAAIGGGVGGGILANKSRTPTTASTNSATTRYAFPTFYALPHDPNSLILVQLELKLQLPYHPQAGKQAQQAPRQAHPRTLQ
jgi:hypothetical protein